MRRFTVLASLLLASTARAAIYENAIVVDDEDDLFTLQQRGDISAQTSDTLLELIREGVDLNRANRDQLYDLPGLTYADVDAVIAYRTAKGRIDDPVELVAAGALTGEQLLQIAPFIRIDPAGAILPVSGRLRLLTQVTNADTVPPPGLFIARLKAPYDLSFGGALITSRRLVATPRYQPLVDTLVTPGFGYHLHVPRAFAQWSSGKRKVVVGTYTVGFGERLTLDVTRRQTPRGIYLVDDFRRQRDLSRTCRLSGAGAGQLSEIDCATGEKNVYITPDYDWREVFRGVAASLEDLELGGGATTSAFGFFSYQARSIYQYELYDRRRCADPADNSNSDCDAPPVFVDEGAGTGSTRIIFSTLPYLFDELAGGAHVDVKPSYRFRIGLTGFGVVPIFRADPMQLDFQEWSRYPGGGAFGAVGLDGQAAYADFNFFLEAARTFDRSVGGGGGFGAIQRTTWSPKAHELELSLRYYDNKSANPYRRPISAPDEYDGQRASNEAGARLKYFGKPNRDWELRARADFWVLPFSSPREGPAGMANLYALARVDFTGWDVFQPALWVDVRNRNLASSEHGRCASGTVIYVEGDGSFSCSGDLYRTALRVESRPLRTLSLVLQGWLTWKDDVRYRDTFRQDLSLWFEVRWRPLEFLHFRLKTQYLNEDLADPAYLETWSWTQAEATWLPMKGTRLGLRYDVFVWLDARTSTASRVPNPEHRFMLDARTSF